jgi:hypothetical protein
MNREEMQALYDRQMRIELEIPGERKETFPNLVRFVRPAPGMNYVLYSKLAESDMDAVIQEQIAYFSQMDQPFNWKIFDHDKASLLEERLVAHGYERRNDDQDAILVLDVNEVPDRLLAPVTKDVRQITKAEQIGDVVKVLEEADGEDYHWLINRMSPHLKLPGYLNLYAGYEDGKPVSCGWAYCYPKIEFAALFGGTTLETQRGKGWFTSILAKRVQRAKALGRRYITMGVEPECQAMLEKFGFEKISSAYYLYGTGKKDVPDSDG